MLRKQPTTETQKKTTGVWLATGRNVPETAPDPGEHPAGRAGHADPGRGLRPHRVPAARPRRADRQHLYPRRPRTVRAVHLPERAVDEDPEAAQSRSPSSARSSPRISGGASSPAPLSPAPAEAGEHPLRLPITDLHCGLLATADDCGRGLLHRAGLPRSSPGRSTTSSARAPDGAHGLLVLLGDLFHAEYEPATPKNKNMLDVDGRFPRTARAVLGMVEETIEKMLRKFSSVAIRCCEGNHDPTASVVLQEAIRLRWKNNPRGGGRRFVEADKEIPVREEPAGVHPRRPDPRRRACPGSWRTTSRRSGARPITATHSSGTSTRTPFTTAPGIRVETLRALAAGDHWVGRPGIPRRPAGPS